MGDELDDPLYRLLDSLTWPELTGDEDAGAYVDRLEAARAGKTCGHVPKCNGECRERRLLALRGE